MTIDNKLFYNDFKIWKPVEENCKISCICFFVMSVTWYIQVLFLLNFV